MSGGGPNPDDFNKPTPAEAANTEVAVKQWDEFLKTKPVEAAYLEDVNRDPSEKAQAVQGQAVADLAQKMPVVTRPDGPNRGMSPGGMVTTAATGARVEDAINRDAVAQQAAGRKTFLENAMGIQSSANTATAGLAEDAVKRELTNAQADYTNSASTTSALSSLAGAGAGMMMATKQKAA